MQTTGIRLPHSNMSQVILRHTASYCIILHHTASYCVLHHTASYCIILHHTASYILHHTASYCINQESICPDRSRSWSKRSSIIQIIQIICPWCEILLLILRSINNWYITDTSAVSSTDRVEYTINKVCKLCRYVGRACSVFYPYIPRKRNVTVMVLGIQHDTI